MINTDVYSFTQNNENSRSGHVPQCLVAESWRRQCLWMQIDYFPTLCFVVVG